MFKRKRMLLLFLIPFFLTGCWDKKDPEDRTFIMTLAVDDGEEGCIFTFAPANLEEGETEPYTAAAPTLAGAVAQVDYRTSHKTDLGQLKTVILGKELLENPRKLESVLRELERSQTVSEKVMLLAAEERAADCIKAVMAEDSKTGLFLWDFYKNTAAEVAVTKGMDLDTFLTERSEQGGNGVLPRIAVQEEALQLGGGMAISADAVYPLSNTEERGYLFLLGEAEGAVLEGTYRGETIPLQIGKSDVRYDFFLRADDVILCTIHLPLEGILQGGEGAFLSQQTQQELEDLFEAMIQEEVTHTMEIAKRAGKDLFGILPRLEQTKPKFGEGVERETLWKAVQFEIHPQLELKDMGRKR